MEDCDQDGGSFMKVHIVMNQSTHTVAFVASNYEAAREFVEDRKNYDRYVYMVTERTVYDVSPHRGF